MTGTVAACHSVRKAYREHVDALIASYHRAVDTIMTTYYGPDWASRGDLPDHAYTAENRVPPMAQRPARPPRRRREARQSRCELNTTSSTAEYLLRRRAIRTSHQPSHMGRLPQTVLRRAGPKAKVPPRGCRS